MTTAAPANQINHIALVLDASASMAGRFADQLVKVADSQIAHLAERSKDLDQETRITVFTFGTIGWSTPDIPCLVWDKDVLRMPSIASLYSPSGRTPLIDATAKTIAELGETPQRYGEHSFLVYVLTDGMENESRLTGRELNHKITGLDDNWTVATFVPNTEGARLASTHGFPIDNIAVWDVNSTNGVEQVGHVMREATEGFMVARAEARRTGTTFRGTKSLFNLAKPKISQVKANLDPLRSSEYDVYNVGPEVARIDEFVAEASGKPYVKGNAYYQLSKRETVQAQKQLAIMGSKGVYTGRAARDLLGLPDFEVKVDPTHNTDYDVFVQSTSVNRKLMPNTKVLVLR